MRRNHVLAIALVGVAIAVGVWQWRARSAPTADAMAMAATPGSSSAPATTTTSTPSSASRTAVPGPRPTGSTDTATTPTTTPSLASGSDDVYARGARFTPRIQEISTSIEKLIDQCYQQHAAARGTLKMSVRLVHDPVDGNLIAEAAVDKAHTTLADAELLQCATENVFASEEVLDKLRADHDPTGGNIEIVVDREFPPPPKVKPPWPADDASPDCAPGTALAGDKPPRGEQQWCQRPDGTKDGDLYMWDKGLLESIMLYVNGQSNSMRMRPPE